MTATSLSFPPLSARTRIAGLLGAAVLGTLALTANGDASERSASVPSLFRAASATAATPAAPAATPIAPFAFPANMSATARARAETCLADAIYYEAGQLDDNGQRAVAQVVLNRVRHPAFPASICGVVFEGSTRETGCQFTFTCDGSLAYRPAGEAWTRARRNAEAMLNGATYAPVGLSTHYHADYVSPPWSRTMTRNGTVGPHLFYGWRGGFGAKAAFRQAYLSREADPEALRTETLAIVRVPRDPSGVPLEGVSVDGVPVEVETVNLQSLGSIAKKADTTPYKLVSALSPEERVKIARQVVEKALVAPSAER